VVTGTTLSGSVSTGSCLRILPQGLEARIRSIHANNREVEACRTGQRCALAIAGAEIDKDNIHRGDWIVAPEVDHLTTKLDTHLRLLEPEKRAIGRQTSVHFHIGAAAMVARIGALDPPSITRGGEGLARILLPRPIHAASGDRFIIRDASARRTIGGGVVLDPDPPTRGQRKADRIALLNRWREGPAAALTALLETNPGGVDLKHFAVLTNRRPENIDRMVSRAHTIRIAAPSGGQAFSRTRWLEAKKKVRITLVRMHRRAPEETGADAETLRRTAANVMSPSAFAQLLGEMRTAGEIAASGRWLHLPDHRVEIIESERRLWQQIQTLLARDPIRPDRSRTFGPLLRVDDARVTKILRRQALANEVFLIAEDYYVLREGVVEFAALVTEEANAKGQVTAAMLRDRLGTGRKMAIWILEFLDRLGYCRRVGDAHVPTGRTLEDLFAT
jgi:selenocysteine-specific elongation factor